MATKFPQDFEDHMTCPICLGQYQDPRLLPCLHTYCKGCLEELLNKGLRRSSIECPECREVTEVEDVGSLRVNIWVNRGVSLLELFKAEKNQDGEPQLICNNCDSNEPAKARCFDCEKYMCSSCVAAHNRMTVITKDHRLMTLEEITDTSIPIMDKPRLCDKHKGKKQKLFCEKCKVLICKDCTLIDHKDHNFSFNADVEKKHRDELQTKINIANTTEENIEVALLMVKNMEEQVTKNSEDVEEEIDTIINGKIQALEERRAVLKQESRNMTALKMKRLSAQEDGLLMHSAALKSAVHFTEKLLKNGNTSDILSMVEQLMSRMYKLLHKHIDDEVDKEDQMYLEFNKENILNDRNFLRLEDEGAPDPKKCSFDKLTWDEVKSFIRIVVRNVSGRPISIKKSRVLINCPFHTEIVDSISAQQLFQGDTDHVFGGDFSFKKRSHFCRRGVLEVLIDGQPIGGSPVIVWGTFLVHKLQGNV